MALHRVAQLVAMMALLMGMLMAQPKDKKTVAALNSRPETAEYMMAGLMARLLVGD